MLSETFFIKFIFIGLFIMCSLKVDQHSIVSDLRNYLLKELLLLKPPVYGEMFDCIFFLNFNRAQL